jgi:hypothetical protein
LTSQKPVGISQFPIEDNFLRVEVTMRPWLSLLCLFLVFLNPPNLIAEDPPAPWNGSAAGQTEGITVIQPSQVPAAWFSAVGPQSIDIEGLLGLPTELRVQWACLRGSNVALMLEGIAGVEVRPFEIGAIGAGIFGTGSRIRWAVYNGEQNAFVLKPGADVYVFADGLGNSTGLGGADVELLWWHNWGQRNRFGFELGADVGSFLFFCGDGFGWWPMVSGIFGIHF